MKSAQTKRRRIVVTAVCAAFVLAGFTGWLLRGHEPLYASPKANRGDTEKLFQLTWNDFLTETPKPLASLPPAPELPPVTVLRYPRGTLIQMRRRAFADDFLPTPVRSIQADPSGVVKLPGGGEFRLAAVALSVPATDDPHDSGDRATEQLLFRRPDDLSEISAADLDALGIPGGAREIVRSERWTPVLRLVVENRGLAFERISGWRAFDERTHASVTEFLDRYDPNDASSSGEGLAILDLYLDIWHDTPLVIALDLPCGTPVETPVALDDGFQIAPVPHARFQVLSACKGPLSRTEPAPDQLYIETESSDDLATVLAYRVFPSSWAWHMALKVRHGENEIIRTLHPNSELALTDIPWPRADIDETTLLHFPERARAIFRLPALPDMPNARNVRNLFDVRIPRIDFGLEDEDLGDSSLTFLLLDTIAGATETKVDQYSQNPSMTVSLDGFKERRFVNVTPRELIAEYQLRAEDPYVMVSQDDHTMRFHRPEPWDHRLKQWWYLNTPDWFPWR